VPLVWLCDVFQPLPSVLLRLLFLFLERPDRLSKIIPGEKLSPFPEPLELLVL
jgi:hypothetical protein